MLIEFPEFLPDLPALNNPGLTVAKNVLPGGNSYKSVPSLTVYSSALSNQCLGAFSTRNPTTLISNNFAGDTSKLYKLGGTTLSTWDDVSKAGGYSVIGDEGWQFTQYGSRVIAVSISEDMQSYTLDSSTLFANLSSDATRPKARYVDVVRDFLFVANTWDSSDGYVPYRVRWSGIGAPTSWTVSATTQADYDDLDGSYGEIKQIIGGNTGTVFQEKAITVYEYVGSPVIFQKTIVENAGTQYSNSVIKVGSLIYYYGLDGFSIFDGNQSIPIGDSKVNKFFKDDLDTQYALRINAAVDFDNHIIIWSYPGAGNTNGRPNKVLFYNYAPNATKRWGYAEMELEFLYTAISEGYTIDSLDTYSTDLDSIVPSLDSRVWTGNDLIIAAFDSNHKLNYFTGTALTATIETGETQINPGQKTEVTLLRPAVDGSSATITAQLGTRNLLSESVTYGSVLPLNSNGELECRSNARYHRMRLIIAGGFNHAIGFEVLESVPTGVR